MEQINLPPFAPTLMESTRAIGYSLKTAIADIIDNSIAARAKNVWIDFAPEHNGEPAYIAILDDGWGMNERNINIAMQYGSTSPVEGRSENDLGRFGLGLKTASLSQCRELTVVTKHNKQINCRRWDLDYVKETGTWSLLCLSEDEYNALPYVNELKRLTHGTLVLWRRLDRVERGEFADAGYIDEITMNRMMSEVKNHLSLVFHRFLAGKEKDVPRVAIFMNQNALNPLDPFLETLNNNPIMQDEYIKVRDEKVRVRPFVLPYISKLTKEQKQLLGGDEETLRKSQGFYIYRHFRLLVWGTWFKMQNKSELFKLARIQVDIPNSLDDLWILDIKKSYAYPPKEVRTALKALVQNLANKSKRVYTYRGKKEVSADLTHVWNVIRNREGDCLYEINKDYPLIQNLIEQYPEAKYKIESLLVQICRGLPLNSIRINLENDVRIENEFKQDDEEVRNNIAILLADNPVSKQKRILDLLKKTDPFCDYKDILEEFEEKIK